MLRACPQLSTRPLTARARPRGMTPASSAIMAFAAPETKPGVRAAHRVGQRQDDTGAVCNTIAREETQ